MAAQRYFIHLLGSALMIAAPGQAHASPDSTPTTLPVSIIDNRPFVSVQVDGKGPFEFLADTGSSTTTITAELSKSLHLAPENANTGSGAGEHQIQFQTVHVNKIIVGPLQIGPLDLPAIDTAELSRVIGFEHFDGVLGVELFQHYVVTINAGTGKLSLASPSNFRPDAAAVAIPFRLDANQMPVVTASIAGLTGAFQVDTGDRSSLTLFGPFWRAHNLARSIAPTVTAMTGYGIGGPILSILGRPANFEIGGLTIPHPLVRLSLQKSGSFTVKDRAGSIGMGVLKRFEVSFDYQAGKMRLSKTASFNEPDLYDRSGLWLGLAPAPGLDVVAVTPDSPAAEAGIEPGDLLTKVATLPAGRATLFEIRRRLQTPWEHTIPVRAARNGKPYETRLTLKDQVAAP